MSKLRPVALAAFVIAIASIAATSTAAAAPCYSSTPAAAALPDSSIDSELGISPELTALRLSVDGTCGVAFSYDVIGQSVLVTNEFYGWFVDADNNKSTGPATGFPGAEYAVGLNYTGAAGLSQWNGSTYVSVKPIARSSVFGASTSLTDIGATPGVPISVAGAGSWTGTYDTYYDWVPEIGGAWLSLAPQFSTTPTASTAPAGCVVPNVRGLTTGSAKSKIRRAGCSVGSTKKRTSRTYVGRAMGTSPGKGTHLAAGARVTIYVGKRAKKKAHGASTTAASPDLTTLRLNQLQHASAIGEH
jgi:hypothetical protein